MTCYMKKKKFELSLQWAGTTQKLTDASSSLAPNSWKKVVKRNPSVGKASISAPGCSLCLKGDLAGSRNLHWFMSLANSLAGCSGTWKKLKLETWWQGDLGRSRWIDLPEWAQCEKYLCPMWMSTKVWPQQRTVLIISGQFYPFYEKQIASLFPQSLVPLPSVLMNKVASDRVGDYTWAEQYGLLPTKAYLTTGTAELPNLPKAEINSELLIQHHCPEASARSQEVGWLHWTTCINGTGIFSLG